MPYRKPTLNARDLAPQVNCCAVKGVCSFNGPALPTICAGYRQNPDGSYTYYYDISLNGQCEGFSG